MIIKIKVDFIFIVYDELLQSGVSAHFACKEVVLNYQNQFTCTCCKYIAAQSNYSFQVALEKCPLTRMDSQLAVANNAAKKLSFTRLQSKHV